MEEHSMLDKIKIRRDPETNTTLPEILFATLLGIGAVSCIWVSSTLLIYLYQNLN